MLNVDYRSLVSRADLVYESPAEASVEGTPIGNGRMGTTVWTTPDSVRFQINRCDVFATDKYHAGHQWGTQDYCGACGQFSISTTGEPFRDGQTFRQHLSVYDAESLVAGDGLRVSCFVSSLRDILVIEIDDQRTQPQPLRVSLSMWRDPEVQTTLHLAPEREIETGTHTASYQFSRLGARLLLLQEFREQRVFTDREYACSSAVAMHLVDVDENQLEIDVADERTRSFALQGGGKTTILLSSSAALKENADVLGDAVALLDDTPDRSYTALRDEHTAWWHKLWSRTFIHLTSDDGFADFLERLYTLHIYYMAATSRGRFPPGGTGLLFQTRGDLFHLGAQYWIWIVEMGYYSMFASDMLDLTDPWFDMYVRQLPDCRTAAGQRWGVADGAFFPETTPFGGPVVLSEKAAEEFRNYLLGVTPKSSLSDETRALCQYESQLFVTTKSTKGQCDVSGELYRPHAPISHIVSSGSEIATTAWWRYRLRGDRQWLREKGYPLLRETAEFYRHLAKRGDDGLYHIHGTHVHEVYFLVNDSLADIGAIRGTVPLAIRSAEILGVDAELVPLWRELLANLAPYPMSGDAGSRALPRSSPAPDAWSAGHVGDVSHDIYLEGHPGASPDAFPSEDVWLFPVFPYENWSLETDDPEMERIVHVLLDCAPNNARTMDGPIRNSSLVRTPISNSRAGRGEDVPTQLAAHLASYTPHLANGLSLFEGGIQSMGVEHSGMVATVLQEGLVQSLPPQPGEPEIIALNRAWPADWNATFRLLARGGFLVSASIQQGEVEFVEIESRLGEECRVRNPWGQLCAITDGADTAPLELDDEILRFESQSGKRYLIRPAGKSSPSPLEVAPQPTNKPVVCQLTLRNGSQVEFRIGRRHIEVHQGLQDREEMIIEHEFGKDRWG